MMIVTDEQVKQDWYDNLTEDYDLQAIVLAHYLAEGDNRPDYEEAQYDYDNHDYLVYTDEEADEAVRDYIEESVWAFTPSFLQAHTDHRARVTIEAIAKLQEMCEDANEPLTAMIKDFDAFVEDAVSCDGRGHFLAPYDHEENEITFNGITYYIYRRN